VFVPDLLVMKASTVTPVRQSSSRTGANLQPSNPIQAFEDNRCEAMQLKAEKEMVQNGPRTTAQRQNFTGAFGDGNPHPKPNSTGMPDTLKTGLESYSGMDLSDVKVHYNSDKPSQLQALAYAQGNEIHLGPGQEKHLPHEGWHVVQQRQGRVNPTLQMKGGVYVNDNDDLEREADDMGVRAAMGHAPPSGPDVKHASTIKGSKAIQRKVGFEFQTYDSVTYYDKEDADRDLGRSVIGVGAGFSVTSDGGATKNEIEIITAAVEETSDGRAALVTQMGLISALAAGIAHDKQVDTLTPDIVKWEERSKGLLFRVKGGSEGLVHFHPQASVGVRFGKITDLIAHASSAPFFAGGKEENKEEGTIPKTLETEVKSGTPGSGGSAGKLVRAIGWSGKADQRAFRDASAQGVRNAKKDFEGTSPDLTGFASILYGFAAVSAAENIKPNDPAYAKYFMPFMLRLGLLPHYNALSKDDRELLRAKIQKGVLATPFLPAICKEFAGEAGSDNEEAGSDNEEAKSEGKPKAHPTIGAILDKLENTIALRDADEYYDYGDEDYAGYGANAVDFRGKLGMKDETDIGRSDTEETRTGAIIELRKLGNDVKPEQLPGFALAVFDLIRLINAPAPSSSTPAVTGEGVKAPAKTTITSE
jgi:hypothetical protein